MSRPGEWDAVVVGSGANGGWAAKTLAELGLSVLVLEAGQAVARRGRGWPPRIGRAARQMLRRVRSARQSVQRRHPTYWDADPTLFVDDVDNPYSTPDDAPFRWIRCRVVGGRTHAWDGVTPRMSDHELSAASRDGIGEDWPLTHADLAPHYARVERHLRVHGDRDELSQLPDGSFAGASRMNDAERTFGARARLDFPDRPIVGSRGLTGQRGASTEDTERAPLSNVSTTLRAALATGRVRIRTSAVASRVLLHPDGRRARGVEWIDARTGETQVARGRLVFLCASTLESVRLLLNSADVRAGHPDGLGAEAGVLGHYVMDHIASTLFFQVPDMPGSDARLPVAGNGSFLVPRYQNLGRAPASFLRGFGMWGAIDRTPLPGLVRSHPGECFGFMSTRGEVLPRHSNRVEIDPTLVDRWGIPALRIHLRWGDNDLAVAAAARRHAIELIEAAGGEVADLTHWISSAIPSGPLARLQHEWHRSTPGLFVHELGGARMGRSPATSVVDPDAALWSVPNVLVTDGACWPSCGWQNPTLTEMAVTDRAARRAVDRASRRHTE